VEIAGVKNTGATTYGKPAEQKNKNSHQLIITDSMFSKNYLKRNSATDAQ